MYHRRKDEMASDHEALLRRARTFYMTTHDDETRRKIEYCDRRLSAGPTAAEREFGYSGLGAVAIALEGIIRERKPGSSF